MKLGILSVSTPELEVEEAAEAYAAAGLEGVGWRTTDDKGDRTEPSFWNGNRTSLTPEQVIDRAGELKQLCARHHLEMPGLTTYVDSSQPDEVARCLRAARALGAPTIRVNPCKYPVPDKGYARMMEESREQFRELAVVARQYGVRLLLETHHGHLAPSVSKALQILEGIDPADVSIIWDPCNQLNEGLETYRMAIDIAGPYLAEVHVKNLFYERQEDGTWKTKYCPVDRGIVRWAEVISELKQAGYNGWLMLEDFYTDFPARERLEHSSRYLRSLLQP